jgi:hypothetical protein
MKQQVKVKIRPGGALQFPAICVYCATPAEERLSLRKRIGRATRVIDLPLCATCQHDIQRLSGEEERLQRLGRAVSVAAAILVLIVLTFLLPSGLPIWLRLIMSLIVSLIVAFGFYWWFDARSRRAALPKKKEILASAAMTDFSWRATTFEFVNTAFCDQFVELNRAKLM